MDDNDPLAIPPNLRRTREVPVSLDDVLGALKSEPTREEVIKVEAIKISYRQTKEGNVVSFRIHPNDNDRYIADMALGQQVLLGVAEVKE